MVSSSGNGYKRRAAWAAESSDFSHNDKLDFSEAMVAGGILGAFADEMMREAERAERESKRSTWDDDDNEPNDDSDEWFDDFFDGDD